MNDDIRDPDAVREKLKGVKETLVETNETRQQQIIREAKAKKDAADTLNPYPHVLRD